MKHVGTALFLLVCLAIGLLLGQFLLKHYNGKRVSTTPPEVRPFEGPIPTVRGFQTALGIDAPIAKWEEQARHDAGLGATWMAVNAKVAELNGPAGAVELGAIVKTAHDANLKLVLVADLESGQKILLKYNPLAMPPAVQTMEPMLAAAIAANVDLLALDSRIGEQEPDDAAWAAFIGQVKDRCKIPLCYIADFAAAPRVSWWTMVDYAGIRGPIALTDRDDIDLHKLQMSWRARQDVVKYLNLRDNVPVFYFDVSFSDQEPRRTLSYQAALTNARGQTNARGTGDNVHQETWLTGMFLRLPENPTAAAPVEAMIKREWK
jgi:hypothetical protein